jgi:hypothetical protein
MCSNNSYQTCRNSTETTTGRIGSYLRKKVTYILGQLDNSTSTGSPDAASDLDTRCGANFQGPDRLSRGTFFYEYLSRFGTHNHRLLFAAKVGHSAGNMYATYLARKSLFGGADLPVKQYMAPLYSIKQKVNSRFLDASVSSPYNALTNTAQSDWTQAWILTQVGPNEYRIQQQKTLRYLEASASSPYEVSTKDYRDTSAQVWILKPVLNESSVYTVQAKSTLSFLDADTSSSSSYSVYTRPLQTDSTQKWIIQKN